MSKKVNYTQANKFTRALGKVKAKITRAKLPKLNVKSRLKKAGSYVKKSK